MEKTISLRVESRLCFLPSFSGARPWMLTTWKCRHQLEQPTNNSKKKGAPDIRGWHLNKSRRGTLRPTVIIDSSYICQLSPPVGAVSWCISLFLFDSHKAQRSSELSCQPWGAIGKTLEPKSNLIFCFSTCLRSAYSWWWSMDGCGLLQSISQFHIECRSLSLSLHCNGTQDLLRTTRYVLFVHRDTRFSFLYRSASSENLAWAFGAFHYVSLHSLFYFLLFLFDYFSFYSTRRFPAMEFHWKQGGVLLVHHFVLRIRKFDFGAFFFFAQPK